MASVPRPRRSMTISQRSIPLLATPAILLMGVSYKQRTMNETASPDSIGVTHDGKENFIWPLMKEQVNPNAPGAKEVFWYTYQIEPNTPANSSNNGRYSPQQIRDFFLKANAVGGKDARFVHVDAFKDEARGASNADSLKHAGTLGVCAGALYRLPGRIGTAVQAMTGLWCIGSLGRIFLKDPRRDDTPQDDYTSRTLDSLLSSGFLEDARIPANQHKSLMKSVEKGYAAFHRNAKNKVGEKCPNTTYALAQVDETMHRIYDAQTPPSATP